jgi:hypothetical protein
MITHEKIARAIKYVAFSKKPVTVENVNRYLGHGEKITQADLDAHHATAGASVAEPEPWLAELPAVEETPIEHVEEARVEEAPVEHFEEAEPMLTVADAQRAVVMSQVRLRTVTDRQQEARGRVGAALQRWTAAIGAVITPEENARQYIASSIEQRALRTSGVLPPRRGRIMRSVIDATAQAYNSGSGRSGGGNAFRRVVRDDAGNWVRPVDVHSRGRR